MDNKIFVIAFEDDNEHYWRVEHYDKKGYFLNYGKVKTFKTREQAELFMIKYTDSRAFDFYVKEISKEQLKKYEGENE